MRILISIFLLIRAFDSLACDICGGASGPSSIGIMPDQKFHFIGFRSVYRQYKSRHQDVFSSNYINSKEYFSSFELNGRYQISKRWQVYAFVPFTANWQVSDTAKKSHFALGDVSLSGQFIALNKFDTLSERKHFLNFGLGVKFPTGKYAKENHSVSNIYSGTGAYEILPTVNYVFQQKKHGLNLELNYAWKFSNPLAYKFGNALNFNASYLLVLERFNVNQWIFQFGVNFKHFDKDQIDRKINTASLNNGQVFSGILGVNYISTRWMFQFQVIPPIIQNMGNGAIKNQIQCQVGINYLIRKKGDK
jgi:hypothetical protein